MEANKKKGQSTEDAWTKQLKQFLLAGVGVVRLAQEEIEDFVNKLVEKGELAEKDGRKWIKEILAKSRNSTNETLEALEKSFESRMEKILQSMNIPTKSDVEQLASKIDKLTKKVEALCKKKKA